MKRVSEIIIREFTHPIRKWGYLFTLPAVVLFLLTIAYPIGSGLFLAFHRWPAFKGNPQFIGIKNFIEIFQTDLFWISMRNTAYYSVLSTPFCIIIPFFLAVSIGKRIPLKNFFMTIYFLPTITSMVAIGIVWGWLYQPMFGLLNAILKYLGLPPQMWIRSARQVIPSLAIVFIWLRIGFNLVLYLAGLAAVPKVLYEAAEIDGASKFQQTLRITLPLLFPITMFLLITTTLSSFQVFDLVYIMTKGGPGYASRTIGYEIYERAFSFLEMGPAMAETVVLFAILLIITIIQLRVDRRLRIEF